MCGRGSGLVHSGITGNDPGTASHRRAGVMAGGFLRRCFGWAVVACLLVSSASSQELSSLEGTVELVLATSESQARVVGRLMKSGYFIDQLIIPDTSYVGRHPLSQVNPGVRTTLRSAKRGEPFIFPLDSGNFLIARALPTGQRAILGEVEHAIASEKVWSVISVGPTKYELLGHEIDVDTEDLAAVCRAKARLIEEQLRDARQRVASLPEQASPEQVLDAHSSVISVLSLKGEMSQAIREVGLLAERLPADEPGEERTSEDARNQVLGILELRRGEVENCLHDHNREMCIFPLSEAGRHKLDDGARKAFDHFSSYLERHPENLEMRWLLNIAAMTLGTYPEGVSEQFRIGPEAFESESDPGRFWDVAGPAGVAYSDNAGGSVVDDFNGDGLLDIVLSSRDPCEPLRLYLSRGDGVFALATESAGLNDQLGGLGVTQVDFDNDGRLDLYVMRGGWETSIRDSLLRNVSTPEGVKFEDVTDQAGLRGPGQRGQAASWADYDGDGWLDLFVGHEFSFSQLFRNKGDGTFEDATVKAGVRFRSMTKGATWGDVNNDGRPDLYVSNFGDRNLLFVNRGDGGFEEVGRESGVSEPTYTFPTWFFDYDNDGWQDIMVVTFLASVDEVAREYLGLPSQGETLRIYRNRGDGTFEDMTKALDMDRVVPTMGANWGDIDNDGYPDIYLGTGSPSYGMLVPNRLFLNQGGERFVDVTTATGTGHLQKGHGVSFGDLDNDGDQDLFVNMGGAFLGDKYPSALFENPGHGNDWIAVELIGAQSSRAALGARIRAVFVSSGSEAQRFRWVGSGGSFGSSPFMQHIGLGKEAGDLRLEIDWPAFGKSGQRVRQVVEDVPVNSWIEVTEGIPGFELRPRRKMTLGGGESPAGDHPGHH